MPGAKSAALRADQGILSRNTAPPGALEASTDLATPSQNVGQQTAPPAVQAGNGQPKGFLGSILKGMITGGGA